jgi:RimJ/RimL family protein N-acetyltransferase
MYKVIIRSLKISDAKISWKWRNDPKIWEYTGSKPNNNITPEIELQWIKEVLKRKGEKRFAICIAETDEYIGNAQLTDITTDSAQYHLFIGETSFWGKGIGKQVANLVLEYAFYTLCVKEVYSYFNLNNLASIKACEKNGFKFSSKKNNQLIYPCNLDSYERTFFS